MAHPPVAITTVPRKGPPPLQFVGDLILVPQHGLAPPIPGPRTLFDQPFSRVFFVDRLTWALTSSGTFSLLTATNTAFPLTRGPEPYGNCPIPPRTGNMWFNQDSFFPPPPLPEPRLHPLFCHRSRPCLRPLPPVPPPTWSIGSSGGDPPQLLTPQLSPGFFFPFLFPAHRKSTPCGSSPVSLSPPAGPVPTSPFSFCPFFPAEAGLDHVFYPPFFPSSHEPFLDRLLGIRRHTFFFFFPFFPPISW